MKQEEKELLKDLCARLPYGVKIKDLSMKADTTIDVLGIKGHFVLVDKYSRFGNVYDSISIEFVKPYLRPMSSMTDEERKEYKHLVAFSGSSYGAANFVDWLNKKMFAYRAINGKDMFELGLALEAPEGMYEI